MISTTFPFMPEDISTHGYRIDSLILWLHLLMLVLFVGWGIFFLYSLYRFRQRRNPRADYAGVKSHVSSYLELGVAVVEGILLFGLSIPLWADRVDYMPAEEDSEVVRVIAAQFQWNIHYPGPDRKFGKTAPKFVDRVMNPIGLDEDDPAAQDDITTNNLLVVPANTPIRIQLTSQDVIHSFFLPELRVKQDAIPGMMIPIWFEATKTSEQFKKDKFERLKAEGRLVRPDGTEVKEPADIRDLEIACAQLCGVAHSGMRGTLLIKSAEEYRAWLEERGG